MLPRRQPLSLLLLLHIVAAQVHQDRTCNGAHDENMCLEGGSRDDDCTAGGAESGEQEEGGACQGDYIITWTERCMLFGAICEYYCTPPPGADPRDAEDASDAGSWVLGANITSSTMNMADACDLEDDRSGFVVLLVDLITLLCCCSPCICGFVAVWACTHKRNKRQQASQVHVQQSPQHPLPQMGVIVPQQQPPPQMGVIVPQQQQQQQQQYPQPYQHQQQGVAMAQVTGLSSPVQQGQGIAMAQVTGVSPPRAMATYQPTGYPPAEAVQAAVVTATVTGMSAPPMATATAVAHVQQRAP